jgi:predicted XRE-type DNA-binding protein
MRRREGVVLRMSGRLRFGFGLFAKHFPRDVWAKFLAANHIPTSARFALDDGTTFGGDLPLSTQPLADGGLLHPESGGHGGLATEAFDGTLNCTHERQYRHCRCVKQAHCLLKALPVAIRAMHTGAELGRALKAAMGKKGVTQKAVATAFGISQPSVSEWIKFGRIGKQHITKLVEFFGDVVGPEHWGLPHTWVASATHAAPPPAADDLISLVEQMAGRLRNASPMARKAAAPVLAGLAESPEGWHEAAEMLSTILGPVREINPSDVTTGDIETGDPTTRTGGREWKRKAGTAPQEPSKQMPRRRRAA